MDMGTAFMILAAPTLLRSMVSTTTASVMAAPATAPFTTAVDLE
jgi:hypothetical protein